MNRQRSKFAAYIAGAICAVLLAVAMVGPVGAHVGGVKHLWKEHIKPKVTKLTYTKTQANTRFDTVAYTDGGSQGAIPNTETTAAFIDAPTGASYLAHAYVNVTGDSTTNIDCSLYLAASKVDDGAIDFPTNGSETTIVLQAAFEINPPAGSTSTVAVKCDDNNTAGAYDDVKLSVLRIGRIDD